MSPRIDERAQGSESLVITPPANVLPALVNSSAHAREPSQCEYSTRKARARDGALT